MKKTEAERLEKAIGNCTNSTMHYLDLRNRETDRYIEQLDLDKLRREDGTPTFERSFFSSADIEVAHNHCLEISKEKIPLDEKIRKLGLEEERFDGMLKRFKEIHMPRRQKIINDKFGQNKYKIFFVSPRGSKMITWDDIEKLDPESEWEKVTKYADKCKANPDLFNCRIPKLLNQTFEYAWGIYKVGE